MPVTWTLLLLSRILWDVFDLDCMLGRGDQFFGFINKFRYLRGEDLPQGLTFL